MASVLGTTLDLRLSLRRVVEKSYKLSMATSTILQPRFFHYSGPRSSVHSPLGTASTTSRKKTTLQTLMSLYKKKEPIAMLTAHDFPSAAVAEAAGMDIILVGDSLAMVALGMEDTSEVTLDEMIMHCRSVSRAAKSAFLVGDMSMGSYEISPEQAVSNAIRIMKEGRMNAVKLEGGGDMADHVARVTKAGIPVIGHVGLTPQRQHALGGFRVQGKDLQQTFKLLNDARAVQDAGASLLVLEAVPPEVAAYVTDKLRIPTIGIGAGNKCSGQVLVQVDMSGNYPTGRHIPKFVKKYGDVWAESFRAVQQYRKETKSREYPAAEHTYPMGKDALAELGQVIKIEQGRKENDVSTPAPKDTNKALNPHQSSPNDFAKPRAPASIGNPEGLPHIGLNNPEGRPLEYIPRWSESGHS
ncbi:MAG: hypothetical protein Q9227_001984 [Pyrenula ochraceoflavens]